MIESLFIYILGPDLAQVLGGLSIAAIIALSVFTGIYYAEKGCFWWKKY